jgi:hypothetical protein
MLRNLTRVAEIDVSWIENRIKPCEKRYSILEIKGVMRVSGVWIKALLKEV